MAFTASIIRAIAPTIEAVTSQNTKSYVSLLLVYPLRHINNLNCTLFEVKCVWGLLWDYQDQGTAFNTSPHPTQRMKRECNVSDAIRIDNISPFNSGSPWWIHNIVNNHITSSLLLLSWFPSVFLQFFTPKSHPFLTCACLHPHRPNSHPLSLLK